MLGELRRLEIESEALRDNLLGDPSRREVLVYTPPGYDEGGAYPLLMVLPAFGATHRSLLEADLWTPSMLGRYEALLAQGRVPPALLVFPDASNALGGSQFVDSSVGGAYQRFLADEVIAAVDQAFRTLADPAARAVVGRSSGGFGALRLGLSRGDVFGVVGGHAADAAFELSLRPLLLKAAIAFEAAGGVEAYATQLRAEGPKGPFGHDAAFVLACAVAYCPTPTAPFPHLLLPFEPQHAALRSDVWARWLRHDPLQMLREGQELGPLARFVYLDAGNRDEYGLHFAARMLAEAFHDRGVEVFHEEFEGGHRGTSWRYERSLPLLLSRLRRE